jgi:hypothetical protein
MNKKARVIAFYLPQFHPIPENDEWWGKGFTEWTNVGKARPLFIGHYQPKVPADLGYYDLRLPEVREAQAAMAREAGIEGFCYWHYWFGNGKRLLERPFNEVLASGKPDFPFCLGWANHSWKAKNWNNEGNKPDRILIEQTYPGNKDFIDHFNEVLPAFKDDRYIRIDNKPVFVIWDTTTFPDFLTFAKLWHSLAKENGMEGVYFIGFCCGQTIMNKALANGFDAVCLELLPECARSKPNLFNLITRQLCRYIAYPLPLILNYDYFVKYCLDIFAKTPKTVIPCVIPNYDHTPRSKGRGIVLTRSTPEKFGFFLQGTINIQTSKGNEFVFLKSWNEWGEGNYLEPDIKYKDTYLQEVKKVLKTKKQ